MKLERLSCARGAPTGRPNELPDDVNTPIKLSLKELRLVDGDYDRGGAYWGGTPGTSMWWAYHSGEEVTQVFVRAGNRHHAKQLVREVLPNASFAFSKADTSPPKFNTRPNCIYTPNGLKVDYDVIRDAMKGEPYWMSLRGADADHVFNACLGGIDSHLEACATEDDDYEWGEGRLYCTVSVKSLPTLLRRLCENPACESLPDDILQTLGIPS